MGKVALLFVAAVFAAATLMINSQKETSLQASSNQSAYQEALLAHQSAESGLQMAMSQAKRDFDAWRTGYDEADFDGGNFDVAIEGTAAGPLQLTATGTFDGAQHQIRATLARLASTPAAVLIDADTVEASLSNDYVISGRDTRPGYSGQNAREGNGSADYANGVWARGSQGRSAFLGAVFNNGETGSIRGTGGDTDIVEGTADDTDLFALPLGLLYGEAITRADYTFSDGKVFVDETFGTPGDPQIVVVEGSAVALGATRGYGMLIVKGSFFMHDDFEWEGIVLAHRQEDDMDVTMTNNASIYGALIGRHGYLTGSDDDEEEGEEGESEEGEGGNGGGDCDCEEEGGTPPPSGPPTGSHPDPDHNNKVLVCHVPPGNPENAHTISISVNALHTHQTHHDDYDGPCMPPDEGGDTECTCDVETCDDGGDGGSGTPPPSGPPTGSHPDPDHNNKVLVCHVPPGNPENAHTISISVNALHTHQTHHDDYDGPCMPPEEGSGDSGDGGSCTDENTETAGSSGKLRFTMRDDAEVFYSTEAIGKLAARLPVVKQASWIIKFDQIGEDLHTQGGSSN